MPNTLERPRYDEADRTRALTQLALCGGNSREAAERLKQHGLDVPFQTIHKWATRIHPERYQEVRETVIPQVSARIALECEDLAIANAQAERQTLEHYLTQIPELKPAETAGALRNIATSKAINVDKAQLLRARPTQIIEQRPPAEILKRLAQRYQAIDSTAVEITDVGQPPERQAIATGSDSQRAQAGQ